MAKIDGTRAESTITNALRVAAEQYEKDAATDATLRAQFTRQAEESRAFADAIEDKGLVMFVHDHVGQMPR